MTIEQHLRFAGVLLIGLALLHITFPRRFGWKVELARLSLLNRRIFQVHYFFVALVVAMMGAGSLFFADDLAQPSALARLILSGAVVFWACRLFVQFFVYDAALWRGNRLHTVVHVVFAALWIYFVAVYGWALRAML